MKKNETDINLDMLGADWCELFNKDWISMLPAADTTDEAG